MRQFVTGLILVTLATVGCSGGSSNTAKVAPPKPKAEAGYPLYVVCTTGMVADVVRNVGGGHVYVRQLMGGGVDPHLYKPTRDDVSKLMEGDLIVYSGLMLEGKMIDTLEKLAAEREEIAANYDGDGATKSVLAITEGLDPEKLIQGEGHTDPHVWMDPMLWAQCADIAATKLGLMMPEYKDEFIQNAGEYHEQLSALNDYGKKCIESIPEPNRVLITSHDAFGYFGRAYGMEVLGIQGLSTESEAGLQRINDLVDMIVQRKIGAVFVESTVSEDNINALIEGAKSRGHEVAVGGELFSDAMGPQGSYGGKYIGMIDHNVTLITQGLGGDAPRKGMNNKLFGR